MLVFYGCYFGKMLHQRRKGIRTNQLGEGKHGFPRVIELGIKVIAYIVPFVELYSICSGLTSFPLWARLTGLFLAGAGVVIFVCAVYVMHDNWRAGVSQSDKTELVIDGPFRFSRNPAFLGFDLVYIGILTMFFNYLLLIVSVCGILVFHLQIVCVEEKFLANTFGKAYTDYCGRVNRYLGWRK